jgi:hypothetical protein
MAGDAVSDNEKGGTIPMSPEARARHDREALSGYRARAKRHHDRAVALKFDGVDEALDCLEALLKSAKNA